MIFRFSMSSNVHLYAFEGGQVDVSILIGSLFILFFALPLTDFIRINFCTFADGVCDSMPP